MRKGNGTDRRLSDRRDVKREREILRDGMLVKRCELHEQVVRMLAIVQRLAVVALPRLQQ